MKSVSPHQNLANSNKMLKLPDIIPTDVSSIRQIGIKNYQEKLFWPVSDHDFFLIIDFLIEAFDDLYEDLDTDGRDILLSDMTFIGFIIRHLHALAVYEFCSLKGIHIIAGAEWKNTFKPAWEILCSELKNSVRIGRLGFTLRRHGKNIAFNSHLNLWNRIKGHFSSDGLSLGSATRLRQEYLFLNSLFIDNHYSSTLLGKCDFENGNIDLSFSLKKKMQNITEVIKNYCSEKLQVNLDVKSLLVCWVERLKTLNTIYKFVLEHGPWPEYFLFTETGQPINKIVAHALGRKGVKTVSFHHGNYMGGTIEKLMAYNGPSSCREFVCPTSKCADSLSLVYKQTKISRFKNTRFTSTETKYYFEIWQKAREYPFREKIRKVMVMGYPMTPIRYFDYPGLYFYFQLDLELRLITLLKAHGFRVLYKIHPEVLTEVKSIFEMFCDKVISEPFENVWHEADALITKYSASTTFGFALCTNRPIFFINLEKEYWDPEHYEELRKRCYMVDAWMTRENRIEFDEGKLIDGLSAKQEYPDFSYLKHYMFPLEI